MTTATAIRTADIDLHGADALMALWLQLQREQWNALVRWQQWLLETQQDAWDQWVCRWGGGVPIDA
jgi:hypothetical protein